jgi:peptidoglycan/LPS O-acetylase OafA/YrhL
VGAFGVQRLPGIHGLRAIAAIGVVFFHVAYVPAFVKPDLIKLPPILDQIVPNLALGVPLFFVISAFSLAYVHDKSIGRDGWIGPYFIKRIFRIGPLFWAIMVAYWFLWSWPSHHFLELLIINATFVFNLAIESLDRDCWRQNQSVYARPRDPARPVLCFVWTRIRFDRIAPLEAAFAFLFLIVYVAAEGGI